MLNFILVYLSGYVVYYILSKLYVVKYHKEVWTRNDRTTALLMALFSWASVCIVTFMAICLLIYKNSDDKPASW